jgi:hypothetical protein
MHIDSCITENNNAFFYHYVIVDKDAAFSPMQDIFTKSGSMTVLPPINTTGYLASE